jgi:phosphomannomutase
MGCILAHYILRNKKILPNSYIVTTFVSTNEIKDICNDYGVNLYITKIGFKWIGKLVDKLGPKHHYLLGFEESVGALPYTNTRDKDAFTSAALILEVDYFCKTHGMDLIDYLYKNIYEKYGYCYTLTDTITINDIHWRSKVLKIINKLQHMNIKEIGGYSIISKKFHKKYNVLEWKLNNNSWIKFRMSGTEPKIKTYLNLYCDKNDRGIGNKVIDSIKLLIK